MTLVHSNGSAQKESTPWLQASVQQFFSGFNWDNQPLETYTALSTGESSSLSLTMTVSQFFGALPWEGSRAIAAPVPIEAPVPEMPSNSDITLDDFSSLF